MIYFFYTAICLGLVIAQTAILSRLPMLGGFYDLLVPFIVYLGLLRPLRESLPFVIFLGLVVGSLSGSPFGLYLTVYFWLYIAVKGVTRLVQAPDRLLIAALVVGAAVLAENLIFMGALVMAGPDRQLGAHTFGGIAIQGLWAFFTGPLFILFYKNAQKWMGNVFRAFYARKGKQG